MLGIRQKALTGVTIALTAGCLGLASPAWAAGANVSGPFAPGVSGLPSGNGQGNARPDAGSVGNADAKNPWGQVKKFSIDPDYGYECDGNRGIAQGNPAHTECGGPS